MIIMIFFITQQIYMCVCVVFIYIYNIYKMYIYTYSHPCMYMCVSMCLCWYYIPPYPYLEDCIHRKMLLLIRPWMSLIENLCLVTCILSRSPHMCRSLYFNYQVVIIILRFAKIPRSFVYMLTRKDSVTSELIASVIGCSCSRDGSWLAPLPLICFRSLLPRGMSHVIRW